MEVLVAGPSARSKRRTFPRTQWGIPAMPSRFLGRRSARFLLLLVALVAVRTNCRAQVAPRTEMVAMADGVKLATDVYLPAKGQSPYPTILVRTPYGKDVG